MIRAKKYEAVSTFVKVMPRILWPLFSPDTVYLLGSDKLGLTHCTQPYYQRVT